MTMSHAGAWGRLQVAIPTAVEPIVPDWQSRFMCLSPMLTAMEGRTGPGSRPTARRVVMRQREVRARSRPGSEGVPIRSLS
jgi:hypothetical protein